ncbi:L-2-hydroxyglutarate oxidase [Legionella impletisoli]|uniref:FAD-dependent oxidoreductase n=1 Tax=Legionella impletisoli TaxID=343510 RepID=A0A917N9U2_9GAMM|nr:L-2-hydroxyglutarate oxidase [Legionella impletisoli]GGI79985.1 FAD-dependent oxidoreductase [Legionella impletisoli]
MLSNVVYADYLIVGAGIIGLSLARELVRKQPQARIVVLEKETEIGLHASGRNSGVLHSGIYYKEGSLKAKLCLQGARAMADYCKRYKLPLNPIGKIITPTKPSDQSTIQMLYQCARQNGANVSLIDEYGLREIEPEAKIFGSQALYSPDTSVIEPKTILLNLYEQLLKKKVVFYFNQPCKKIDIKRKKVFSNNLIFSYGHLFNTAGLNADIIAKECGIAEQYTMIPFKGIYYELKANAPIKINHLIYPAPDMNVPFLGVHFTRSVSGKIYIGPSAFPAFGREHYGGIKGMSIKETLEIFIHLARQYISNKQGFRLYAHQEIRQFTKAGFIASARQLIPRIQGNDLVKSSKVGIRAQLYDKHEKELVMDFLFKSTENETHVLNAVSPAFTSAFSFSKLIIDNFLCDSSAIRLGKEFM